MAKVLITGISGFIGSSLAHILVERGYDVYGMMRHTASRSLMPILDIKEKITLRSEDVV